MTVERVLKASVPAGSRFKGYEDCLVRELHLSAEVIRYRRERWLTPAGETVVAPLPLGIGGGFGPELRRFVLALHAQGQVTTERLTALVNGIGVEISRRQVVRLLAAPLDDLVAEDRDVLRAGLATARWVTVDDTAARHARGTVSPPSSATIASPPSGPVRRSRARLPRAAAGQTRRLRRQRDRTRLHA